MRVAVYFLLSKAKEQLNEEMSTWRQSFIQYFVYIEVNRYIVLFIILYKQVILMFDCVENI